jgi:ferritin-like metal-binding protein YciE
MADKNLDTLFHDTLKDIYFAEKAITKALPKMAKAAHAAELKDAFRTHLEQTKAHVQRLEQVFELMGKKPQAKTCEAINGIIKEGDEIGEEYADSEALDAGLLAAAQAVEHYEISRYGTLRTWAEELGMDQAAQLFEATLNEEKTTDQLLTKLAITSVNLAAEARAA